MSYKCPRCGHEKWRKRLFGSTCLKCVAFVPFDAEFLEADFEIVDETLELSDVAKKGLLLIEKGVINCQ